MCNKCRVKIYVSTTQPTCTCGTTSFSNICPYRIHLRWFHMCLVFLLALGDIFLFQVLPPHNHSTHASQMPFLILSTLHSISQAVIYICKHVAYDIKHMSSVTPMCPHQALPMHPASGVFLWNGTQHFTAVWGWICLFESWPTTAFNSDVVLELGLLLSCTCAEEGKKTGLAWWHWLTHLYWHYKLEVPPLIWERARYRPNRIPGEKCIPTQQLFHLLNTLFFIEFVAQYCFYVLSTE